MHDISVLDDIVFPLCGEFSSRSGRTFATKGDIVLVFDNLCPDKASLKVGVYYTGGLRSLVSLVDSPCPALVSTGGEKCL